MITTVKQTEPIFNGPPSVSEHTLNTTGPAWYLNRQHIGALNRQRDPFATAAWMEAVNTSNLADVDKQTASHIAASTGWYGTTNVTRTELAALAGVTRVATVTARLDRLRTAGYIGTKQRYNAPMLTALTFPMEAHATVYEDPGCTFVDSQNLHDSEVSF